MKTGDGKIAVYSRKSRFTGKGESIENQIELCRRYIRAHDGPIGEKDLLIYEDEGFSGGNLDRPQFKKMMSDARSGKFSSVVCYRLDRISRNIGDFARLIEELENLKISFVSIREQFDTSSPMGRAMMYIASVFSQLERETIAERIRDNMRELAKTGRWLGGVTPTGYASEAVEKVAVDGKVRKAYKLRLIPEEAELVRRIYQKFRETGSLTKTETYLIQNNLRTKNGRLFTRFTIRNLLENPVYMTADADALRYFKEQGIELFSEESAFDGGCGIMAYNKTIQKRGKANRPREVSEWIVAVGRHKGMIKGADWIEAQRLLNQNKSKAFHKPKSPTALLSGLLRCGGCGAFLRPKLSPRRNARGERVYRYLCEMKEKSRGRNCGMKNIDGNTLDQAVCGEIRKLPADPAVLMEQLENIRQAVAGGRPECDEERERLREAIQENDREISALVSALAKSVDTPAYDYIIRQIGELHEKGRILQGRMEEQESRAHGHALSDTELEGVSHKLSSFRDTFDGMTVEQKRAALRRFVEKIVWDGENVHVYLLGSGAEKTGPQGENSK